MSPEGAKSEAEQTFAKRASSYESESGWVRDSRLIDPLFAKLIPGEFVLDVCSGTGAVGRRAQQLGLNVIAMDLSEEMLAQNELPKKVRADASCLPFGTDSFTRVLCRQGLHYLDLRPSLLEWVRVAVQGASIGTITMVAESDRLFWREYFAVASPGRRHIFGPGQLREEIENLGMTITAQSVATDRGSLLGPIRHLDSTQVSSIKHDFLSRSVARNYDVQEFGDDLLYLQRWEFLMIGVEQS